MRTLSRFLSLGLCSLTVALAGINDGIGGVKVGLGKNPPGNIKALAVTDSTGTVRFRITEPGTYTIEIQSPLAGGTSIPATAAKTTLKLSGQASKAITKAGIAVKFPAIDRASGLATGSIFMSQDAQRIRVEHPGINFDQSGRSYTETIEVNEPMDLTLRLTDDTPDPAQPTVQGLPEYLNFVAIEGGASPITRDIPAVASVRGITAEWVPNNGATLRITDASQQPASSLYRVAPTTQSLRPGFYTGNIDFRGPDGTKLNETIPVYIRILPRESRLPPIAERHTYWAPAGNAIINVLNPNLASETIRLENPNPRDGWGVQLPPAVTLTAGQAGQMQVSVQRTALTARNEEPKELRLVSSSGQSIPVYLLMQVRQVTAGEAATCRPTKLFPMFAQVFQSGANELGSNFVVEVRDDCNRVRDDATGKVTDESTALSKAVTKSGVGQLLTKAVTKSGGGQLLEVYVPPTDTEPAIEGKVGGLAISGLEIPDLSADDKPVAIEEIVNATSGEPSALAPGMLAYMKLGYKAPPVPPAVEMSKCGNCFQTTIGGVAVDVFRAGDDGLVFEVPEVSPQERGGHFNTAFSGIKTIPRGVLTFAPSSPAVETQADGTAVLLKHADLEAIGEDYALNGGAPPQAGDLVSVFVTGLGQASLKDIQILVGGSQAALRGLFNCPGAPQCQPTRPRPIEKGTLLLFTMPEIGQPEDATEGGASIQVWALGIGSNIGTTSPIKYSQLPPRFRVITSPSGLTVQVNGSPFTYTPPTPGTFPPNLFTFFADASGNATFDVVPDKQPDPGNPLRRWDFDNWSIGGARQQTAKISNYQTVGATFKAKYKITVTGATVANRDPDDFYPPGTTLTLTPTCPTGQVLDTYEVETRSTATGNLWIKYTTAGPTILFNTPGIVTTRCRLGTTTTQVQVTLNTNLGPLAAQVQGLPALEVRQTGPGGSVSMGWPTVIQPVNPGAILLSVNPAQILNTAGNVRFDFVNWTGNGIAAPGTQSSNQQATMPNAATTYTANFDVLNRVEGTITGTCTISPAIGSFIRNGSNVTFNVTPASALTSAVYAPGAGAANVTLTNGQTFQFVGGTLTVNCSGGGTGGNACVQPPPGPAAWWPMESAALPIQDILPLGLNAVANPSAGSALPTAIAGGGKVGNALRFNGTTQTLSVPHNPVFDSPRSEDGFTLDAWVKLDGSKDGGAIFGNHRNTGLNGYHFGASRSRGVYLYLGAYRNINGYEIFPADVPIPNDGQWHFVAARLRRIRPSAGADPTSTEVKLWVDGATRVYNVGVATWDLSTTVEYLGCASPSGPNGICWANPVTAAARPILIGTRDASGTPETPQFEGGIDELEYFKRPLTDVEVAGIYNAGSFGKCKPPVSTNNVNVTVITNPPSVQAEVGIGTGKTAGLHQASLPASSAQTLTAQDPFLNVADGNYYRFNNWTPAGPNVTLPATGNIIYTANYVLTGYQVDASGCGITVGPASRQISANPLVFGTGGTLTLGATPPSGQTFQNFTVSPLIGGGATTTFNTNPANIPFTGPVRIVANCGAAATVPVTVTTNLGPFAASVQGTPALQVSQTGGTPASGWPTVTQPVNPGAISLSVSPTQILNTAGNIRFDFKNWTGTGIAGAGTQASNQAATMPNAATTYTANFDLLNRVEGTVTGTCTVSPAIGSFVVNGSNVTFNVTPASALVSATYSAGIGATSVPLTNGQTFQFVGGTLTVNCGGGAPVNVTVITAPPSVQAEVGIGTGKTAGIHQASLPASSGQTLTAQDPFLGTDGNYYRFNNWTPSGPNVTLPATGNVTYTANYTLVGYQVDASGCGITVGPTSRQISANPLIFSVGGTLTLGATPPTGQTFQSFSVTPLAGGGAATTYNTNPVNIPFNGPIRIVANCGAPANITITLVSNPTTGPTELSISHGGGIAPVGPGPRTLSIPVGDPRALTLAAERIFEAAGTGYAFTNFTPGPLTGPANLPNVVTVTPKPTASTTYTANYGVACHILTFGPNPAGGGTVTVGSVPVPDPSFSPNCYAPGATVTLTATPASGRTLTGWTGATPGTGNTATVVMSQPRTVTANFGTPTNVTLTIATVPAGLDARIGTSGAFAPAPISSSVQANSSVPVAVTDPITRNGTGYRFSNWTGGPAPASSAAASSAVGTTNLTVTANFTVACYVLTTNVAPAGGGTVSVLRTTSAAGFGSDCFAPGTVVSLVATPAAGRVFTNWTGAASGPNQSIQVTMTGPLSVTANFAQAPVIAVVATSRSAGTGLVSVNVRNSGGVATNARVTAIASATPGITWDPGARVLPSSMGNLPNGGDYGMSLTFRPTTGTAINAPFNISVTVAADNFPSQTFTVTTP